MTVNVLTYNSSSDLERFFNSLRQQTFQNFDVLIIDNASTDQSGEISLRLWPGATIIRNDTNLGYAGGHNVGLAMVKTDYVLVANLDITLSTTFIEKLMAAMDADDNLASVGGKLIRMSSDLNNEAHYGIIDSAGLAVLRNRRFIDRGQGEKDLGLYDVDADVFGLSGALVMYRAEALKQARLPNGQYFDERYFMYREDIDLAWRLQHYGWHARYIHTALAWHRRTAPGVEASSDHRLAQHRRSKSDLVNYWSYRNHLYTLLKNERQKDFLRDGLWITWFEVKKLIYILMFERHSVKAWGEIWRRRHSITSDRHSVQLQGHCHMSDWRI